MIRFSLARLARLLTPSPAADANTADTATDSAATDRRSSTAIERWVGWGCVSIIAVAALTLSPALTRSSKRLLGTDSWLGMINEQVNPFRTRHALLQSGLPVYDLKFKPSDYREILGVVEEAKTKGKLTDDLKQWSDAKFIHDGITRDVDVRVRGDFADHWANDRRSWRVRFRKDNPLWGQREINLIVMQDGKSITGPFTNAVFKRAGMMTLPDGYVVLRINGIPQGVYYRVDHWGPELLARNRRPETSIFRNPRGGRDLGCFEEQVAEGDPLAWSALEILTKYEAEPTSEGLNAALALTDMDDYLRYLAGVTLFGADHTAAITDNHRLYYDTSRGKFQRVPWDLEPTRIPKIEHFALADWHATFDIFARWPMSNLHRAVLQNDALRTRRNRLLWEWVKDDALLGLFDEVYRDLDIALWADVMGQGIEEDRLVTFRGLVRHNIRLIRRSLAGSQTEVTLAQDSNHGDSDVFRLEFAVDHTSGIEFLGIRIPCELQDVQYVLYRDSDADGLWSESDTKVGSSKWESGEARLGPFQELLPSSLGIAENLAAYIYQPTGAERYKTEPLRTVAYPKTGRHLFFLVRKNPKHAESPVPPTVILEARNAVTGTELTPQDLHIRSISRSLTKHLNDRGRSLTEFIRANPNFQEIQHPEHPKAVLLGAGVHRLNGEIVLPQATALIMQAGAELRLGPGAALICFGPILAEGKPEAPVTVVPDGAIPWNVIATVESKAASVFRHVHVQGGGSLEGSRHQGIYFTGALAIHHGDLVMEHCRITDCPAEDGLNVKNGHVSLRDSEFVGNAGDGVDLDFITGEVTRCVFLANGGDGLDFSGAKATVEHSRFERSADKGISVGEQSQVTVFHSQFLGNTIGLASKDLSNAIIEQCRLLENKLAVAAYRKKPMFGGGTIKAFSSLFLENGHLQNADGYSLIRFEDCACPGWDSVSGCANAPASFAPNVRTTNHAASTSLDRSITSTK